MATPAAEARQKAREQATKITAIVAVHHKCEVKDLTNWTKLGPEAVFIIADVEDELDQFLPSEVKHTLNGPNADLVALIAAFQDPA